MAPRPEVPQVVLVEGADLCLIEAAERQLERGEPDLLHLLTREEVVVAAVEQVQLRPWDHKRVSIVVHVQPNVLGVFKDDDVCIFGEADGVVDSPIHLCAFIADGNGLVVVALG